MARRKQRHMSDDEMDRETFLEDQRMEIENVCEQVRDDCVREFRMSRAKAYKVVKAMLKQIAKYGF